MGKGSRLGSSPCTKQAALDNRQASPPGPQASPPNPGAPGSLPQPDLQPQWSPQIRGSLGAQPTQRSLKTSLRSAWGEEPLHPRKISSRRMQVLRIAEERKGSN